ncbi:tetratricopeptide repeat protein [Myxococcota bacterium]|nr:tetratricopeptide repeat protein [Myxococcota bacterium]
MLPLTGPRLNAPVRRWLAGAALLALTLCTYAPSLSNGFIWDDDAYVTENDTLPDPSGLSRIWFEFGATPQYYPLVHTTFWLEYRAWGLSPRGYHAVNLLLHALAVLLAWRVMVKLEVPGAWAVAAIFAVHPVHLESVAWVTERKNVLSAVFYLAAALAYLRFAGIGRDSAPGNLSPAVWYALAWLAFLGALLSKTVAGSLPAALLLVVWWKRGRIARGDVIALLPFFVAALSLGAVTLWMEEHRVGATGPEWDLSPVERLLIAGRAVVFYLGKLVWPVDLSFVYPRWRIDASLGWQYLFPLAVASGLAILWWARRVVGRGPLVAALFFGGTLVPALGFFDVYPMRYSFVADHFQYLASLGPIGLGVAAVNRWVTPLGGRGRAMAGASLVLVLLCLSTLSWRRLPVYEDLESLWTATLETNPDAWMASYNLGNLRRRQGREREAIELYRAALSSKPDHSEAHNNLATSLGRQGDLDEAIYHYRRAIHADPDYLLAHVNLARVLELRGFRKEAARHRREAKRIDAWQQQRRFAR